MSSVMITRAVTIVGLVITIFMIGYAIYYDKYIEASAISAIGPLLIWFLSGGWKSKKRQDDDPE